MNHRLPNRVSIHGAEARCEGASLPHVSPSQHLVPAVSFPMSRIIAVCRESIGSLNPAYGRSLTRSRVQSKMDRDNPHQEERHGGQMEALLAEHGTPVVASLMSNAEHFLLRADGPGTR
jgi:hypothetical protein